MDDDSKATEKKVKITPKVSRRTIKIKIKGLDSIYKQAQEINQQVKEEVQEVADQEDTNNNKDQTMISSIDAADGPSPSTYSGNLEDKAADDDQEEIKEKVDDSNYNNSNNSNNNNNNNNNNKNSHVCILCHKCFSTNKKLHGHMRVHPERTYRGMVPPEGTVIKNTNIQSGAASLKKDQLSWGHVFRRGRIGSSSQTQPPRPSDPEGWMSFHPIKELDNEHSEEDQAAVILQMISEYETDYSISDGRARSLLAGVLEYYQEERGHNKLKITEDDDDDDDGEAVEEQVVQLEKKEYRCQTCKRSFSTPQALGGHRASHSKVRNNVDEGESSERGKQQVSSGVQEIHQCKQCPAFYSCGQALGGHMRKHFLEEQAAESTSVKVLRSPRVSNFDLNLKPCDEEEEEGGGGGGVEE